MKRKQPPLNEATQAISFTRRTMVIGGAQAAIGVLLAVRMGYISVAENERYAMLSESNRLNLTPVPPRRGWVVDRYGKALADNRVDLRVDIIPERLVKPDATLAQLRAILSLSNEDMERITGELERSSGFQPVAIAEGLSEAAYAAISVRLPELPGVAPARGFARNYPSGAAVGHLMGYVGTASAEEFKESKDPLLITPGFKIGKDGLEKQFEQHLRGVPGAKRVEVTATGKVVRELTTTDDTPGKPIQLTLNADLQEFAARRLGRESGSVVVMDCHTGELLAISSMPAFDPNSFSGGIGHDEWRMLSGDERKPLLNKPLKALYPPGSTIKPMGAMALLSAGVDPEERVNCPGGYQLGNRFFRCLGRHGSMTMHTAIAKSCNTYFYAMGNRIGYDPIAAMGRILGLGAEYDLPVVSQSYGTVPDSAWKLRKYDQEWTRSDTLNASIGQGYLLTSPLQLAVMAARIASGRDVQPLIVGGSEAQAAPRLSPPQEHFEIVRKAMWEVVNGNGTAGASRLPIENVAMGGKTGTAQVRRITDGQRGQGGDWRYRDHGLFVFFAPTHAPRFAGAVVIDHGMGGSRAAAPVARDVLTFLYDRQKAMTSLLAMEEQWGGTIAERMAADMRAFQANGPIELASGA